MQLGIGELAGRIALVVGKDLDGERHDGNLFCTSADVRPDGEAPATMVGSPLDRLQRLTG